MIFTNAKNIEEFKENARLARIVLSVLCLIALVGIVLSNIYNKHSYQSGFFIGLFTALGLFLIKSFVFSKNEQKMKATFIKTYDERNILIQQKAAQRAMEYSIIGLGMSSLIVSIFDLKIAMTLGLSSVAIALVYLLSVLIVKRKL